jgi:hypothetical protein
MERAQLEPTLQETLYKSREKEEKSSLGASITPGKHRNLKKGSFIGLE